MNIPLPPVHRAASAWCGLALAALLPGSAFAATAAAAAAPAPTTHVLFMGADIALEKNREFHRVEDVTGTSLVIKLDGKTVNVPQFGPVNLRIDESLKLARTNIGIAELKAERAYTAEADPFTRVARAASLAAGENAVVDMAQSQVRVAAAGVLGANIGLNAVRGTENEGSGQAAVSAAEARQAEAQAAVDRAYATPMSQVYDVGAQSVAAGVADSREMFDAIRLTFEVMPESELAQPYYVVIAQIRERDSKPGQVRQWAYVKSLGAIGAGEKRKVTIFQGGLPPGYILGTCEVHLYDHGEELATSLSRKRVPLTDAEAQEYRIIEYVGAHKGRTLPAVSATTTLAGQVRATLTAAQLDATCHVRVDKGGRVAAVYRDAAGQQPLEDPALEAALKTLRFKPALAAGKPVESLVPLTLRQLTP